MKIIRKIKVERTVVQKLEKEKAKFEQTKRNDGRMGMTQ